MTQKNHKLSQAEVYLFKLKLPKERPFFLAEFKDGNWQLVVDPRVTLRDISGKPLCIATKAILAI